MKCQRAARRRVRAGRGRRLDRGALVAQLLRVVLAEIELPRRQGGDDVGGRHLLADRDQLHVAGRAAGGGRGGRDARAHVGQVAGDLLGARHVASAPAGALDGAPKPARG